MLRMKKRYNLINFICLLAVYKKNINTGRVFVTRILRYGRHVHDINVIRGKALPEFIMSSLLLSKMDIGLKLFFIHNVRYGKSVTFRIWMALESLQYLNNHEP